MSCGCNNRLSNTLSREDLMNIYSAQMNQSKSTIDYTGKSNAIDLAKEADKRAYIKATDNENQTNWLLIGGIAVGVLVLGYVILK